MTSQTVCDKQAKTAIRRHEAISGKKVAVFDAYANRIDVESTKGERYSINYDGKIIGR